MLTMSDPTVLAETNGHTAAPAAVEKFDDRFLLVVIKSHRPEFRAKLDSVTTTVDGKAIDEAELDTKAKLLPDDLRTVLSAAFKHVSRVKEERTIPYGQIPAIRVLPRDGAEAFFEAFGKAETALHATLEADFYPFYELRVREAGRAYWQPRLGSAYEQKIGRHILPLDQLRKRIGVEAVHFSISYKRAADADAAIRELAESLRGKLADAVEGLRDQLATGKKLTADSFNNLKAAIRVVRGFDAFADAPLLKQMDAVEVRIKEAADAAASASALGAATQTASIRGMVPALSGGLDGLLSACRDEAGVRAAVGRFGGAARPIRPRKSE